MARPTVYPDRVRERVSLACNTEPVAPSGPCPTCGRTVIVAHHPGIHRALILDHDPYTGSLNATGIYFLHPHPARPWVEFVPTDLSDWDLTRPLTVHRAHTCPPQETTDAS